MIVNYQRLYDALEQAGGSLWAESLPRQLERAFAARTHGRLLEWRQIVEQLPHLSPTVRETLEAVRVGQAADISARQRGLLEWQLKQLGPWRKGPYWLYGIHIDSEWRSDWKWARLHGHIGALCGKLVLDVGCGNGYHCWRMLGEGARLVVGIDPMLLHVMQFHAVRKLYGAAPVYVLPIGIEAVPDRLKLFDTVFSMGVLYHRRSPIDHLLKLKSCLRPGGELVLETLVIEGGACSAMVPKDRYANMRNVWFIPSCDALTGWLTRCGFKQVRLIDKAATTVVEQRSTDWMPFHSLVDFLDPKNPAMTREGLPAPVRALFSAIAER